MATGLNPNAFNKDEIAKLIAMRVKAGKLPREDVETGIIKHLFKNGLI